MSDFVFLFNEEQERHIKAERAHFNTQQKAIDVPGSMVGNASTIGLRDWERIDSQGFAIQRDELVIAASLASAGIDTVGIADIVNYYGKTSDSGGAVVSMEGRSQANGDRAQIKYVGTTLPVVDDFVTYDWREMEVLRKGGGMLVTDSINNSQRKVAETFEDMVLNGSSVAFGDAPIYGLRTFPDRKTATHTLAALKGATGAQWLETIRGLIELQENQKAYGNNTLYVNFSDWRYAQMTQFSANYVKTIAQAVEELAGVEAVVPSTRIPANEINAIAGLRQRRWGATKMAMPMSTTPLNRANIREKYVFSTMMAGVVQFKSDYNGNSMLAQVTKA